MSTAITSATISSDLKADPDEIWAAQALPAATTLTSSAFKLGQTMGGVEVKVVCSAAGTATAAILTELQTSATSTGSYVTQMSETQALGAIAVGDVIASFILPREHADQLYAKLKITTTEDESDIDIDAYLVFVS